MLSCTRHRDTGDPLNVLMVNTYHTGGGAGRVGELLAQNLREGGDRVTALVSANPTRDSHCRISGHWRENALAKWISRRGFAELGRVSSFLWGCRPEFADADVLHLHNLHGDYLSIAAMPLWARAKPIIWTLHDFWPLTGNCATPRQCTRWRGSCGRCPLLGVYPQGTVDRSRFYRWLKPRLFAAARPTLVTPSRWLAERVREVPLLARLDLRVIPNPVDCDLFRPIAERAALRRRFGLRPDTATVVMVGADWSDPFKGGRHAVAALRRAAERPGDLQLLVIGQSGDRILAESGVPGRAVPFVHERETLAQAYACGDVCLFPSLAETCGLIALEAAACGTPVVAYRVGGVPEQIQHLASGYLAREADAADLANGLTSVLADAVRARWMGARGREFVLATSSAEIVTRQYRRLYAAVMQRWRARHGGRDARINRGRLARALARRLGWESDAPTLTTDQNVPASVSYSELRGGGPRVKPLRLGPKHVGELRLSKTPRSSAAKNRGVLGIGKRV